MALPAAAQSPVVDSFGSQGAFTTDATASGTLGALNAAVTLIVRGRQGVGVQIVTTNLNATVTPEISFDGGTTWIATAFVTVAGATSATVVFGGGAATEQRSIILTGGASHARVRVSSYTSGTTTSAVVRATSADTASLVSVPGTVSVTQGTSPWVVGDGGGSLTVDNGGTFAVQAAQSGTWTVQPGNTANTTAWLTTGTGGTFPVTGGFLTDTQLRATPVPVSGTVTTTPPSNASTNVAQFGGTNVSTGTGAGGAGIPRVTVSSDSTLTSIGSITTAVTPGFGATNLGKRIGDAVGVTDVGVGILLNDGGLWGYAQGAGGRMLVTPTGGSITSFDSIAVSVNPGNGPAHLGKDEDAAHASSDRGVYTLTVRQDTPASSTTTDGDYQSFKTDSLGRLHTNIAGYLGATASASNAVHTRGALSAPTTVTWTSASGLFSTSSIDVTGYNQVAVEILCTGTVTGGGAFFRARNFISGGGGTAIRGLRTSLASVSDNTITDTTTTFATSCGERWTFQVTGLTELSVLLSPVITGAGSVQVSMSAGNGHAQIVGSNVSAFGPTSAPAQVGSGTATNALRVELPTNGTGNIANVGTIGTSIVPGTGATNLGKAEDAAAGSGDTGNSALFERQDGTATLQTTANAEYIRPAADGYGAVWQRLGHPNAIRCTVTVSTATTIQAVGGSCAAPGAGLSIYVTDVAFSASASGIAADAFSTLKYGTGGTCGTGTTVFWGSLSAAANIVVDNRSTPIKIPANNEICWINSTAGSKFLVISGFIAP